MNWSQRVVADIQDRLLAPLDERKQLVRLLGRVVDHHARERSESG
jgi:hypothetical protein